MLALLSRRLSDLAFTVPGCALILALLCVQVAPVRAAGTVGDGTPASCTSAALDSAIAAGSGNITFACGNGGGLYLHGNSTLTNVTISGNQADNGGGIRTFNDDVTLTNVTLYQNSATSGVGGFDRPGGGSGSIEALNTIIANNTGGNCGGPFDTFAFNLSSDGTCSFGAGRDNVNPMQVARCRWLTRASPTRT